MRAAKMRMLVNRSYRENGIKDWYWKVISDLIGNAGCLKRMIITIYKDILGCEILNYRNFYVNVPKLLLLKRFLRTKLPE